MLAFFSLSLQIGMQKEHFLVLANKSNQFCLFLFQRLHTSVKGRLKCYYYYFSERA